MAHRTTPRGLTTRNKPPLPLPPPPRPLHPRRRRRSCMAAVAVAVRGVVSMETTAMRQDLAQVIDAMTD